MNEISKSANDILLNLIRSKKMLSTALIISMVTMDGQF